jgi:GT2 family glycosyltransferase
MKLSIVIICWNDLKVIKDCLRSIYEGTHEIDFEVIVSDNGSKDGSQQYIRENFPKTRIIENNANLGFAKANNVGIRASLGDYVLILNPDTIVHEASLDKWIEYADRHPEAGAFGCRILNPDGSLQISARPFPTVRSYWLSALYLHKLAYLGKFFASDLYLGWDSMKEQEIDWQSGCCLLFRRDVLTKINGFDEQFFYHFEEVDLCRRAKNLGRKILYTPYPTVTHLGGQSVNRFPIRFQLEKTRNQYRYFYKHFGRFGALNCKYISLTRLWVRQLGFALKYAFTRDQVIAARLKMYKTAIRWNLKLDPMGFVLRGDEPAVAIEA